MWDLVLPCAVLVPQNCRFQLKTSTAALVAIGALTGLKIKHTRKKESLSIWENSEVHTVFRRLGLVPVVRFSTWQNTLGLGHGILAGFTQDRGSWCVFVRLVFLGTPRTSRTINKRYMWENCRLGSPLGLHQYNAWTTEGTQPGLGVHLVQTRSSNHWLWENTHA